MMLGNLGIFLLAPFLATSSFMGFGSSDGYAFANAKYTTNVSNESRLPSWGNWNWGDRWQRGPAISRITPDQGEVGTEVTLRGARFTEDSIVRMGDGAIHDIEVSNNGRVLRFVVPEYMGQYCPPDEACTMIAEEVTPGDYDIRVVSGERTSNSVTFEVLEDDAEDPGLSIDSIDGPTSLALGAEGTWTVNVSGADSDLRYSVKWGDEGFALRSLFSGDDSQASATFTHTYDEPGQYTPEFTVTDGDGEEIIYHAATVTVGEDGDVVRIDTITPATATAGAKVTLSGVGFDGDTKVWVGRTAATEVEVASDSSLSFTAPALTASSYRVRVTSDEGESNAVALKIEKKIKARVSVSGVDAPSRLTVDQEGTWTVHAASNADGNLSYSVDWGEDNGMSLLRASGEMTQSSATFTHSYAEAGTYHPKFTVTDEDGNKASVSASVVVK
jgi:PKD repeat protein